jgi:cytochrome-b5 reductase
MDEKVGLVLAMITFFTSAYLLYLNSIGKMEKRTMFVLIAAGFAITIGVYLGSLYSQQRGMRKRKGALQRYAPAGSTMEVPLSKKVQLTHDTYLFEFQLPDPLFTLGLEVGQHITILASLPNSSGKIQEVRRNYTPVSRVDYRGTFELVVKIYRKDVHPAFPKGGLVSQYLESLNVGDKIKISGPKGGLVYHGKGKVSIVDLKGQKRYQTYKALGLIAGGTGITPMYQIMKQIHDDKTDPTKIQLLFANKSDQDILMKEELEILVNDPRFSVYYVLDLAPNAGWTGFQGFVTQEMLEKTLPKSSDTTLICQCGPPAMSKIVLEFLKKLGHKDENVYKF